MSDWLTDRHRPTACSSICWLSRHCTQQTVRSTYARWRMHTLNFHVWLHCPLGVTRYRCCSLTELNNAHRSFIVRCKPKDLSHTALIPPWRDACNPFNSPYPAVGDQGPDLIARDVSVNSHSLSIRPLRQQLSPICSSYTDGRAGQSRIPSRAVCCFHPNERLALDPRPGRAL